MARVELFLLRVWKRVRGGEPFRAALRTLDGDAAQVFTDPDALATYLQRRSAATSRDSAAAPDPADGTPAERPPA
jgi:hypothetical protein